MPWFITNYADITSWSNIGKNKWIYSWIDNKSIKKVIIYNLKNIYLSAYEIGYIIACHI